MRKSLIFTRKIIIGLIFVFVFSFPAVAVTLTEYRDNITHLKEDLDAIINPSEDSTDAENLTFEREVLEEFPKLLPAKDKVEWQNSTVEVNNRWIYEALERFKKEPRQSPKRLTILSEIRERLAALELKSIELENQTAENRKDADKQKLAEILQRAEFQKPEDKKNGRIEEIYKRIVEWLMKLFARNENAPSSQSDFQSFAFVLQMIILALILGFIGFLIYRFAPFFMHKRPDKIKKEKKERVVLGERLEENETAQSLFGEAENLAQSGNLRAAIRKGYIALLCELSDKKIIRLSQHKTNRDYLRDVRDRNDLHAAVNNLTANYERHWYGFKGAEEKDWEDFKNSYRRAVGGNG